jgi:competence protein ComEA
LAALGGHAGGQSPDPPEPFTRVCGNCHSPERILAMRRSRDQWQEVVENMVSRGARGTDDDLDAVMKYLVARYGRVNVNRAGAPEIGEVLAIGTADAQKIVDYRRDHGKFEDMDALLRVPGIDADKLRGQREAVSF